VTSFAGCCDDTEEDDEERSSTSDMPYDNIGEDDGSILIRWVKLM